MIYLHFTQEQDIMVMILSTDICTHKEVREKDE